MMKYCPICEKEQCIIKTAMEMKWRYNKHLMMMNAGTGFYHEESVHPDSETVEMLQIFFRSRKDGLTPAVQFHQFEEPVIENNWRLIGGNEKSRARLKINSDVSIYDILLKTASIKTPALKPNKVGLLYLFEGEASINNDNPIKKGDSVFTDEPIVLTTENESVLVYIELDTDSLFSRNGLYAQ